MNLLSLAAVGAVALLSITDPTGDAHGDGTLTPPTSPIYAHSAIFDLQELYLGATPVNSGDEEVVTLPATFLSVTLGAVDPDDTAPAGFSGVVVDVYLDYADGGSENTLVGPGMLLPLGSGWDYAVRLSPAGAFGVAYDEPDAGTESVSAGDLELQPLALRIDGNRLIVELPVAVSEDVKVYAVTGVYDPFASTSWRPLANTTSPWAYSGGEQVVPVIDVLAVDQAAQTEALQTGALPRQLATGDRGIIWLVLMGLGLLVAGAGLWLRRRVVPEARSGLPYGLPPEPEVVASGPLGESEVVDDPVPSGAKPDSPNPLSPDLDLEQDELPELEQQEPEQQEPEQQEPEQQEPEQQEPEQQEPGQQEPEPQEPEQQGPELQEPEQNLKQNEQNDAFALFGVQLAEDEQEEEDDDDDFLDGISKRLDDA